MGNIVIRMILVKRFETVNNPEKLHQYFIFYRLHLYKFSNVLFSEMSLILDFLELFVLNFFEKWNHLFLNLLNWQSRKQNSRYSIGTVLTFIEISEIFFYFIMRKSVIVSYTVIVVRSTCKMFQNFPFSTVVFTKSKHAFFVNCLSFFFDTTGCKKSLYKEIA